MIQGLPWLLCEVVLFKGLLVWVLVIAFFVLRARVSKKRCELAKVRLMFGHFEIGL